VFKTGPFWSSRRLACESGVRVRSRKQIERAKRRRSAGGIMGRASRTFAAARVRLSRSAALGLTAVSLISSRSNDAAPPGLVKLWRKRKGMRVIDALAVQAVHRDAVGEIEVACGASRRVARRR
jgi:hypothetical protein